ncbi:LOW QUALITY PROTEIN: cullin-3-like [Neosynchiropus ocellatus]
MCPVMDLRPVLGVPASCPRMAVDVINVNNLWELLKNAIQKIQVQESDGLSFEELYRHAYTMVLHKQGEKLYKGVQEVITEHLSSRVLKDVLNAPNFLQKMNQAWADHMDAMVMTKDIVMYLDRVYIQTNRVPGVYHLGLILFRSCILGNACVQDRLRQTLLDMIALERKGEVVDRNAIRSVCQMMMTLGQGSRSVYEENFEETFLDLSQHFFKMENQRFIDEKSPIDFTKKMEARFLEETERVRSCLDKSTEEPLVRIMEEELISKHMKNVVTAESSGLIHMLQENKTEDLASMYKLFSRTQGGMNTMCECLSTYLRDQGTALMLKKPKNMNPVSLVQALLNLTAHLDHFLLESFNNDKEFKQTITRDLEYLLSLNPRSPEFLSLFIDNKLRRRFHGLPEKEVEWNVAKVIQLFRSLRDKDAFRRYYSQHVANRLLYSRNFSQEYEMKMVSQMTAVAGAEFTVKLQGMLADMSTSVTTMEEYSQASSVELTVKILTNGYWPVELDLNKYSIPSSIRHTFDSFRKFYLGKHPDRRLILQPHMGMAEVNATFQSSAETVKTSSYTMSLFTVDVLYFDEQEEEDAGGTQTSSTSRYILQVSTLQMIVLILFNKRETWTFQEIQQKLNVRKAPLISALQSLACGSRMHNVLSKEPKSKEIKKDHVFGVNDQFSSRRRKVKISSVQNLPMFP